LDFQSNLGLGYATPLIVLGRTCLHHVHFGSTLVGHCLCVCSPAANTTFVCKVGKHRPRWTTVVLCSARPHLSGAA
jgi:hypothetical protein